MHRRAAVAAVGPGRRGSGRRGGSGGGRGPHHPAGGDAHHRAGRDGDAAAVPAALRRPLGAHRAEPGRHDGPHAGAAPRLRLRSCLPTTRRSSRRSTHRWPSRWRPRRSSPMSAASGRAACCRPCARDDVHRAGRALRPAWAAAACASSPRRRTPPGGPWWSRCARTGAGRCTSARVPRRPRRRRRGRQFATGRDEAFHGFGGRHSRPIAGRRLLQLGRQRELRRRALRRPRRAGRHDALPQRAAGRLLPQASFVSSRPYGFLLDRPELARFRLAADRPDAWQADVSAAQLDYVVAPARRAGRSAR